MKTAAPVTAMMRVRRKKVREKEMEKEKEMGVKE